MIYVLITYIFYPFLYFLTSFKKSPSIPLFQRGTLKSPPLAKGGAGGFSGKFKRILVIQTAKIGDLICSTPLFREIKKKYPDVYLTVMVNPVTKELLDYNPNIDKVIAIKNTDYKGLSGKLKLSGLIRRGNYDVAICLNPNVPFAISMLWGLVPVRISVMPDFAGTTFKLASVFFTYLEKHIRGRLVIETYMKMLKVIGIESDSDNVTKEVYTSEGAETKVQQILQDDKDISKVIPVKTGIQTPSLREQGTLYDETGFLFAQETLDSPIKSGNDNTRAFSKQNNKPLIGIAVSSGNKLKELGHAKISELANSLLGNLDAYIVLIGSEGDRETAETVFHLIKKKDMVIDVTGKLSLSELPALIERLSLFIGVDTGITYMADALSVPLIDIAGPSDTSDQRPLGKNSIIIQKDIPCVPCSHTFKAPYSCKRGDRICITSVNISEIVEGARKLLTPVK